MSNQRTVKQARLLLATANTLIAITNLLGEASDALGTNSGLLIDTTNMLKDTTNMLTDTSNVLETTNALSTTTGKRSQKATPRAAHVQRVCNTQVQHLLLHVERAFVIAQMPLFKSSWPPDMVENQGSHLALLDYGRIGLSLNT
jgi:hypothetical protein